MDIMRQKYSYLLDSSTDIKHSEERKMFKYFMSKVNNVLSFTLLSKKYDLGLEKLSVKKTDFENFFR